MDEREAEYFEELLRSEGLYLKRHRREVQAFSWVLEQATYEKEDAEDSGCGEIEIPFRVLSPMQQEVIYCLFYDMRSLNETAKHLNISRSSVKVHRDRALKKLREELEERGMTGLQGAFGKARSFESE
ncbi:sigma factor-like helix-turn-helix DNA-binding protein [Thermatribacter velox]|uniref:Sigma factor-like helix-turn-helix DNA-binding protein n=1 Tax=Thermatribacter velox TaxID=3039681 RepID=A0ABZ2YBA2_9BACT